MDLGNSPPPPPNFILLLLLGFSTTIHGPHKPVRWAPIGLFSVPFLIKDAASDFSGAGLAYGIATSLSFFWSSPCLLLPPSIHRTRAIREERLGSYSVLSTMPIDEVLRFRSIFRCNRFDPPPRWKTVIRPEEFLPADFPVLKVKCLSALPFRLCLILSLVIIRFCPYFNESSSSLSSKIVVGPLSSLSLVIDCLESHACEKRAPSLTSDLVIRAGSFRSGCSTLLYFRSSAFWINISRRLACVKHIAAPSW